MKKEISPLVGGIVIVLILLAVTYVFVARGNRDVVGNNQTNKQLKASKADK